MCGALHNLIFIGPEGFLVHQVVGSGDVVMPVGLNALDGVIRVKIKLVKNLLVDHIV